MNTTVIRTALPSDASTLFELSCISFGHHPNERPEFHIPTASIEYHLRRFSYGAFIAEQNGQAVGFTILMLIHDSPYTKTLTWHEAIGGLSMKNHSPSGNWLYWVDFGVHPDFRKQGIGTALCHACFDLTQTLYLDGFYAAGMLAGYKEYSHQLSPDRYAEKVRQGLIVDQTVTMQMNRGFELGAIIPNYTGSNPEEDSAMTIVWKNPSLYSLKKAV